MPLAGKGVLAIWNGIADEAEADFVAWHIREHIPERVAVPGFGRGRRYIAVHGHPKYFNFYETENPAILTSQAYRARLDAPSAWTRQVVRHFRDTSRTICSVAASIGLGDGGFIGTIRLEGTAERENLAGTLEASILTRLLDHPGIVAAHLLQGHPDEGGEQSAEKALRSTPDESAAWIMLIEAADCASLQAAIAASASISSCEQAGATYRGSDLGLYRLQFALSRDQIR